MRRPSFGPHTSSIPLRHYCCFTRGLTDADIKKVSAFHRRQLRKLLGVRWPQRMSNDAVYATTGVRTLEQYIGDARMRLLGHVLRLDRQAPAQQSMDLYVSKGSRQVGRPRT